MDKQRKCELFTKLPFISAALPPADGLNQQGPPQGNSVGQEKVTEKVRGRLCEGNPIR